ncbi:MAG TPA: GSCFA domain-containing protein [Roseiarcus sp.]|nr:GSCFA domain-containing protein [Roseiarcus sp.]
MSEVSNPYERKGPAQFWRTGVAAVEASEILPLRPRRFLLDADDSIATAGSCFAQNLAKRLHSRQSTKFLRTEFIAEDQPLFSALYGNIYTVRQLVQLFDEAFEQREPALLALRRPDGRYVDALRPNVFAAGFADQVHVLRARLEHLAAVRRVFTECTVFVFTLGLTESWRARIDGTVYPLAPPVVSDEAEIDDFEFHNFTYQEITEDLRGFVERISKVNPGVRILLTVSPVPLTATYTDEHVLVASSHSKAILRAACAELEAANEAICYFPAYEIITGPFSRGAYYEANLRSVAQVGVDHVMRAFDANFLASASDDGGQRRPGQPPRLELESNDRVICDEEELTKSIGF